MIIVTGTGVLSLAMGEEATLDDLFLAVWRETGVPPECQDFVLESGVRARDTHLYSRALFGRHIRPGDTLHLKERDKMASGMSYARAAAVHSNAGALRSVIECERWGENDLWDCRFALAGSIDVQTLVALASQNSNAESLGDLIGVALPVSFIGGCFKESYEINLITSISAEVIDCFVEGDLVDISSQLLVKMVRWMVEDSDDIQDGLMLRLIEGGIVDRMDQQSRQINNKSAENKRCCDATMAKVLANQAQAVAHARSPEQVKMRERIHRPVSFRCAVS